ncbi:MAG TPA: hypothetical protein VD790_04595 [Thermoleophilaceae bacterium]|nr:hypothetical protein [Thermoleophilaceae bacterium]
MRRAAALTAVALAAGCGGGEGDEPIGGRVAVPNRDSSPPSAAVSLRLPGSGVVARAAQPGGPAPEPVRLTRPRLTGTTVGTDEDSGLPRVRVAVTESISCRAGGGRIVRRPRVHYFPPSQVERIRSAPGARIPVRAARTETVRLGRACPAGAEPVRLEGELWGDATNGLGLEAVTPHIHFRWSGR